MESNIEGNLVESAGPVERLWVYGSDSARMRQMRSASLSPRFLVEDESSHEAMSCYSDRETWAVVVRRVTDASGDVELISVHRRICEPVSPALSDVRKRFALTVLPV